MVFMDFPVFISCCLLNGLSYWKGRACGKEGRRRSGPARHVTPTRRCVRTRFASQAPEPGLIGTLRNALASRRPRPDDAFTGFCTSKGTATLEEAFPEHVSPVSSIRSSRRCVAREDARRVKHVTRRVPRTGAFMRNCYGLTHAV